MPFRFDSLAIVGAVVITPRFYADNRGGFSEVYKKSEFLAAGIDASWKQINWSSSRKNVLRGMHYQLAPNEQGKLVSVLVGEIFDVVIDIRVGSPTYGKWVSATLHADKRQMIWVPPGFAHGFYVLSEKAEVTYSCTAEYSPESERGIIWNDPEVGISWPVAQPILSAKDELYPTLAEAEKNISYQA